MKKFGLKTSKLHRVIAATVCLVMVLGLVFQVTLFSAPEGEKKQVEQAVTRVADASTINSWKEYFGDDTSSAGKIWTDKSVMTTAPDLVEGGDTSALTPQGDNFMVGLSALSSSKSVVGESDLPIDAVFVVDISNSMGDELDGKTIIRSTVESLNEAIDEILKINEENRVGVVLYSGTTINNEFSGEGTAVCPMPLGRYKNNEAGREGKYFKLDPDDAVISIESGVEGDTENFNKNWSTDIEGHTYTQNGLMKALKVFSGAGNNVKEKTERVPVITLLTDGAPTTARDKYTSEGPSTIGVGDKTDLKRTFLTQLTAAWMKSKLDELYVANEPLFYSIGVLSARDPNRTYAEMVLNPKNKTSTDLDRWWNQFFEAKTEVLENYVTESQAEFEEIKIEKADDEITNRYYIDQYFPVSDTDGLKKAFKEIVEKVRLQSVTYPTDVEEEQNPNYSGYLVFEDEIGEYMHIEHINGIMYEGTLYNGKDFADKMSQANLNPLVDEHGKAFLDSLMVRLGIDDISVAQSLFENARDTGQISSTDSNYSNYIGWYADETGRYVGAYVEGGEIPSDAKTINKSYFYYKDLQKPLEKTNLMYLGVRVTETIGKRGQTVRFSIPASLIPMIRYNVTKTGQESEDAEIKIKVEKTEALPIHLFYEVGIDEGIDEYAWNQVAEEYQFKEQRKDSLRECKFYANAWIKDQGAAQASMKFEPSIQNDFYYFVEESLIYTESNGKYIPYSGTQMPSGKSYYYQDLAYSLSGEKVETYKEIDENLLSQVVQDGSSWYIPKGMLKYDTEEKLEKTQKENSINGVDYVKNPSILTNVYNGRGTMIEIRLGNNGEVNFRQGKLVVKKQVKDNAYAEGHDDDTEFEFEMRLYPLRNGMEVTRILEEKEGKLSVCALENEMTSFPLKNNEYRTYWLPLGQDVSIQEVGEDAKKYETSVNVTPEEQSIPNENEEERKGEVIISEKESTILFVNDYSVFTAALSMSKIDATGEGLEGAEFAVYKCKIQEPRCPEKPYPPDDLDDPNYQQKYEDYVNAWNDYLDTLKEYKENLEEYENHIKMEHQKLLEGSEMKSDCWELFGEATSAHNGRVYFKDSDGNRVQFSKGLYRLVEKVAPKGYMKPVGEWNIKATPGGNVEFTITEVRGMNGERPPAILQVTENTFQVPNYKPIDPPITGGRGIDRFLILGGIVTVSGLMITVHLVLQRKRGKL